jgi:predicted acylesterase/phospholipase RssA
MSTTTPSAPQASGDPDRSAAHQFLSELRTRITLQPLPYQHGVEARALESLREVFDHAREAMKNHPGCQTFADEVTRMLNVHLRPVTAKWHRALVEGRLNSRDGADEFRGDLAAVQKELRKFAARLHEMAYGRKAEEVLTGPALSEAEVDTCFQDIPFGIVKTSLIPDATVAAINESERQAIDRRRELHSVQATDGCNAVGLALSGGGIRSATFGLGAVQVLAARGLLKDVDFLSTVSGGGYTGSFLTTRLGNGEPHSGVAGPYGPDPLPIRYLRQHAKFLAAVDLKQSWTMVTAALAGLLLNWTAPLMLITIAALAAIIYKCLVPVSPWGLILAVAGGLTILTLISYGWLLRRGATAANVGGWLLAIMIAITALLGIFWLLDISYDGLPILIADHGGKAGILVGLVAAGPAIIRFIPVLKTPAVRKIVLKVLLLAAGVIIPLGALTLFYVFWHFGAKSSLCTAILVGVAVLSGVVAILILNVNLTGLHRLYRDQLSRTFVQHDETLAAPIPLATINPGGSGPYHLVNTTLNVPSSTNAALRDRKSDFFLFSKHWCGSPATGYHRTGAWRTNKAPPDLATAMAISGAAASPYMGLGSMPTLTALLTFLNVRLGFWMLQPGRKKWLKSPGFSCLIREMTGIGMSEKQAWINLSDGGHLENMAIYELLRRRCKFIICVDGESDPDFTFEGLMTLVRHAQIDFGARIDSRLNELRPDAKTKYGQTHAAFTRIRYPDGAVGLLLYMKLSVTGNESELIRRYRTLHPDFPHQSTLDQFFDEEQFEAYRQLGVHVTDGLFSRALMNNTHPTSVPQWFRQLAANLLLPEEVIPTPTAN